MACVYKGNRKTASQGFEEIKPAVTPHAKSYVHPLRVCIRGQDWTWRGRYRVRPSARQADHLSITPLLLSAPSLSLFLSAYPPSWIFTPLKKTENQCLCNLNLCPEPTRLSHVDLMTFEICSEPTGSHLLRAEPRGCVLESEPGAERSPAH